jgi:hypothetical protein
MKMEKMTKLRQIGLSQPPLPVANQLDRSMKKMQSFEYKHTPSTLQQAKLTQQNKELIPQRFLLIKINWRYRA